MSSVSVNCPKQSFAVMGNLLFLKMLRAPKRGERGISRAGRAQLPFSVLEVQLLADNSLLLCLRA